jgi:hypothetical protein
MAEGRQYFSQLKKSLLTKLVRKHKDLVENEKNDYKTIQQKNNTWEALSEQFNSQSGVTKRDSRREKVLVLASQGWRCHRSVDLLRYWPIINIPKSYYSWKDTLLDLQ